MSQPSSPSAFQVLFNAALQDYKDKTGNTLTDHPIAKQLGKYESISSIVSDLQEQARSLHESRENDGKLTKALSSSVDVLCAPSISSALNEAIGVVVRRKAFINVLLSLMAPTAIPACKSNICRLRYLTRCMSLFLHFHHHISLTFDFPRRPKKCVLATMHWSTSLFSSKTS